MNEPILQRIQRFRPLYNRPLLKNGIFTDDDIRQLKKQLAITVITATTSAVVTFVILRMLKKAIA